MCGRCYASRRVRCGGWLPLLAWGCVGVWVVVAWGLVALSLWSVIQ